MTALTLNSLDLAFGFAEKIEDINFKKVAYDAALKVVEVAAVVVAISTYIWLALCLFWEEHGDVIQEKFTKFVTATETVIRVTYRAGIAFRPVANRVIALGVDKLYYTLTDR